MNLNKFIDIINEYTDNWSAAGIVKFVFDVIIVAIVILLLYFLLRKKVKAIRIFIFIFAYFLVYAVIYILGLSMSATILSFLAFWSFGIFIIVYNQDIKHFIDNSFKVSKTDNAFTSVEEKKNLINIIMKTIEFLSKRQIGALITIEREDNLNTYIGKAITINGDITAELLSSLFIEGTATHDGAVIIRKNKIMCAGAYYPSTDKFDVPKFLGTRHRAAIGISERYDAFTVVVSEETGNISTTLDGVINLELSLARVEEMLDKYIPFK
ncbi:MAG: diadenylate cyclase [Bacilli bacterium]|nr:diadenylate cyclase [Bacilli bacterium]